VEAQDWKDMYEERAAMKEYCAGMARGRAEAEARKEVEMAWGKYHGAE